LKFLRLDPLPTQATSADLREHDDQRSGKDGDRRQLPIDAGDDPEHPNNRNECRDKGLNPIHYDPLNRLTVVLNSEG